MTGSMDPDLWLGLAFVLLGGAIQGAYVLPLKYTTLWKRENTWLVYSVCAMLILPWAAALSTVPDLIAIYHEAGARGLWPVALCGMCWGLGNVLYGSGVLALGIALGTVVILGVTAALGSFVPLLVGQPDAILRLSGLLTMLGVVVMLIGVAVCAIAGREREQRQPQHQDSRKHAGLWRGLSICVASGILSAFLNFGLLSGSQISDRALAAGATPISVVYPVLALLLAAGFIGNGGHSLYGLARNRTWRLFAAPGSASHWALAALMGVLLFGGYVCYGIGVAKLGALGPSVGWGVFLSMFILSANLAGILTGEWKSAGPKASRAMLSGNLLLLMAIAVLGMASTR